MRRGIEFFPRACYNGNMTIRKNAGVALAVLLFAGTVCGVTMPPTTKEAAAQEVSAVLTTENSTLFLPESYEQYLALESPSDVALSRDYIAVADGSTLYLYERGTGATYLSYEADATISKIQFSGDKLYFTMRGTSNSFWYYDCIEHTAQRVGSLNCSTFLIVEDTLYTAVIAGSQMTLARRSLSDLEGDGEPLGTLSTGTEPWLAWANGMLYCIVSGTVYYSDGNGKFEDRNGFDIADYEQRLGISSVCSDGTYLYFSSSAGFFRRGTGRNDAYVLLSAESDLCGVSALTYQDGVYYCIRGSSVHEIAVSDTSAAFTDYEIAESSASINRLSEASDTARAGELLVTADTGNSRVNIYNFSTKEYTTIACETAPTLVATDGAVIACAAGAQVYICDYSAGETAFTSAQLTGANIAGLAVLYGETYYIKSNGTRGVVGGEAVEMGSAIPTGLACDLYGTLYVSYTSGNARAFTEDEFISGAIGADTGIAVAPGATSLKADFEGNLYYLVGGDLYCDGTLFATVDGSDFVYTQSEKPVSFALGFEDDAVYFNFGEYMIVSDASTESEEGPLSGIPTLGEIAQSGARETTFSMHEGEGLLVNVAARSVGISTDISLFRASDSAYFPYGGYARLTEERQGLLLATTPDEDGGYALVLFPEADGSYSASLYKRSALTPVGTSVISADATRWLSNDVSAYFVPCLEEALSERTLSRGTAVHVTGSFSAPDREYALIEYTDEASGTSLRGWVPASYLSDIAPDLSSGEQYTFAYLKSDRDGVVFTTSDGAEQTITERVQVRLYDNGDGTFTARLVSDPAYSAVVTEDMIDRDNAEVLRLSLIIILTVLALVIVGVYVFLLPWGKYKNTRK